jgi:hypothetical protein
MMSWDPHLSGCFPTRCGKIGLRGALPVKKGDAAPNAPRRYATPNNCPASCAPTPGDVDAADLLYPPPYGAHVKLQLATRQRPHHLQGCQGKGHSLTVERSLNRKQVRKAEGLCSCKVLQVCDTGGDNLVKYTLAPSCRKRVIPRCLLLHNSSTQQHAKCCANTSHRKN